MSYFPEDFQCIPQCLKNSFPQKYIFKTFDTVASVVLLALDVGGGRVLPPLSMWGPGLAPPSLSPQGLSELAQGLGMTGSLWRQNLRRRRDTPARPRALPDPGSPPDRWGVGGWVAPPGAGPCLGSRSHLTRLHTCEEGSWGSPAGSGSVPRTPWSWRGSR